MVKANREWKSFGRRWNGSSRFAKFLFWSILVHAGLLLLIALPVYSFYEKGQEQIREQQVRQQADKEQEKEVAREQAREEVKELLKEDLVKEQLKPFFDELTREYLDPKTAEAYFQELMIELDPALTKLREALDSGQGFEPVQAERMIQDLREQMVQQLAQLVERQQLEPLRRELLAQLKELARQVAEQYRRELAEKVGQPIGEQMRQLVLTEAAAAQAALEKADRDLSAALQAARQASKELEAAEGRFPELKKQQAKAEAGPKKDTAALTAVRKGAQEQRASLLAVGKQLDAAKAALKTTGEQLATHMPRAAEQAKSAEAGAASAAQLAKESAQNAQQGKLDEAAATARSGKENARKTIETLERARAGVQLQLAANQADRVARETVNLARASGELARELTEAARLNDTARQAKAAQGTVAAGQRTAEAQASAEQLMQRLVQADAAVRELDRKGPAEAKKLDAQGRLDVVRADLKQGREALAEKSAGKATDRLENAAKQLEALRKDLRAAQERVGIAGENQAEALAQRLDDLRRQKLSEHIRQKFEQDFKDKGLPALVQKVNPVLAKRLEGDPAVTGQFKQEVQKELARILSQELPAQVRAGERFAETAGERLKEQVPAIASPVGGASQRVKDLSAKAEAAARQLADKQVPAVVAAGVRAAPTGTLMQGQARGNPNQTGLLRQLEIFRNQLAANRREFMGRPDAAALAAAARRYQDRQAGLSRLNDYDAETETYRKLMTTLKERGQLTGEEILRQGASGELSTASAAEELRPAQVLAPDLATENTPPELAPEKKDDKPAFKTIRFAAVPFLADDAVTIDGDLADWKGVKPLSIDQAQVGGKRKQLPAEPAQTAYLAYCPRGLLVAVDVTDTSGRLETQFPISQFWLNDCVEVYIDTLNTKYNRRGETNTHQFFAFPFEHKEAPGIGGYESKCTMKDQRAAWEGPVPHAKERMPTAWKKTDKGWTLEMLIPRAALRRGEVQPGRILGFNVQIDTGHGDRFYYWSCLDGVKTSEHPNVWGDVQLLGSDGKVELIGEDSKETVRAVVPGLPVRVRVTDPDMNLDEQKKDKVSVTLRTASGEAETLILEETANASGIFVGSVATRLNIGSRLPSTLQVFEGEKVVVEYIDQVRSTTERNKPVRAPFAVSAVGTRLVE